jgi:two-component system, chemotaxis family, CheB/CheR fusion protein
VGVGASAGGLEAFRRLLAALPAQTGMAYVLVQHLDPSHESALAELLARATRMPVSEVKGEIAVEPDHVYVAPAPQDITFQAGRLKRVGRERTHGQHMPIDSFLRTLAEVRKSQAIGVILSGTGSDGTLGVKAVKAEGGITFAQNAGSAAYDGMPQSAIASGCVDFVLPPEEIARKLANLSGQAYVRAPHRDAHEPPTAALKGKNGIGAILALLRKATGADFGAYKPATIRRRIARRMALAHLATLAEYARHLEGHPDEVQALYQDCLITVTSFFRDAETFQLLCKDVLPRLLKQRSPGKAVRVWVPGCATGEEVYSIVICLLECAGEANSPFVFQVFATDLSESNLQKARSGTYPATIAQDVSPERLRRSFTRVDGGYQVNKAIRDMCVFARHDLTRDPPFSRIDLISCRNVLIYLEPRQQQRVLAVLHYALQPSGIVLLGASETAGASQDLFTPVDKKHRIYSRRLTTTVPVVGFARSSEPRAERREGAPTPVRPGPRADLLGEADQILLTRYAPPGVIVDEKDNIVEFRGQTDPYLEHAHGRASLNVFKMARKGLLFDLRQAIQQARKKDASARKENAWVRHRGQIRRLDIEVIPLEASPRKERSFLVLFDARPETKSPRGEPAPRQQRGGAGDKENASLKRALADATRQLHVAMQEHEAANEELQASSEEVLSANEELQSINEELETAKEELQSSNEELTTLNQEMHDRNLQLGIALDYANAIVETVRTPLLLLDADLRVGRVTERSTNTSASSRMRRSAGPSSSSARGTGTSPPCAARWRRSSRMPPASRTSKSNLSFRTSVSAPCSSTPAGSLTPASGTPSSSLSMTRRKPGKRTTTGRRCSTSSGRRGCMPSRRTGSRTSSSQPCRTSCADR